MKKIILGFVLIITVVFLNCYGYAQYVPTFKDASGTVSTSSTQALAAGSRQFLLIQNISANNLGITFDGSTAAIGTPGTVTLAAGQGLLLQNGNAPSGAIDVIGSASSTTYTIKYL